MKINGYLSHREYIRNTSSIIPGWDIKRNSADMRELGETAKKTL